MKFIYFLDLIRIKDWLKNILIFFPLIFSGYLFNTYYYYSLSYSFLVFCIASSSIYVLNDILDLNSDKNHPIKVNEKPLASGKITLNQSYVILIILVILSIISLVNSKLIFYNVLFYIFINLIYNLYFKKLPFIEMSLLAFGYVIRIDAGSKVIELESSNIMLLSTFFLAFFFISLKRLGELNVLSSYKKNINIRPVLNFYSSKILKCIAIVSFLILDLLILLYIYYNDIYLLIVFILGLIFLSKYYFITRNSVLGESPINLILKDKTLLFIAITSLFIILFVYL